jgi:hypothetical protein
MNTYTITDENAHFECPEGTLCGTAVYEIRIDPIMDTRTCDLVIFRIGGLALSRYRVVDAVGETEVASEEERHLPVDDPMGAAADRAWDRTLAETDQ